MRPIDRLWLGRKLVLLAGDTLVFILVVASVTALRHTTLPPAEMVGVFFPVLLFAVAAAYTAGLYELRLIRDFVALVGGVLASGIASFLFGTTYFYWQASQAGVSPRATLFLVIVGTHIGMLCWRRAVLLATGFNLFDLKISVLADSRYCEYLCRAIGRRPGREFNLVEHVAADVNLVVLDPRWSDRHPEEARRILAAAIAMHIPTISVDEFHESLFGKVSPGHASDLAWALEHVLPRSGSVYFKVKRVLDVIASTALLLLLMPTLALVAIAVAVADKTTPFYGQMRIGYLGRPFRLWKFRTMRQDADREGPFIQTSTGLDRRVTPLGYLLRRLRVDELPQLWNVLKGDMSLVGPRPEWTKEVEILEKTVQTYRLRYLVPPGITGWAQVYFRATNNPQDSIEKHNYDLYYLKHFSLAVDLSIMLKTVKRVFIHDSRIAGEPMPRPLESVAEPRVRLDIASIVGRG